MPSVAVTLLAVLVILEVKHFFFDYPLQTGFMLREKVIYGQPGGIVHAGLHVLGTAAIFAIVRPDLWVALAILAGEFVIHYNIDWAKGQVTKRNNLTTKDAMYWWGIGLDQLLHHLTHVVIAAVLVWVGAIA